MNVLIIEDEILAAQRLSLIIKQYDSSINIIDILESVEDAVLWLSTKAHPDLLMVDIHLADGHSFEIFKKVAVKKPIIFTTAYDQYSLDAFQLFSIDYILKPITALALANALNKYKLLSNNFVPEDYGHVLQDVKENLSSKYKNRFLAKVGQRLFFVPVKDVAYFAADNKIVFLVTNEGKKYIVNITMEKLETMLDPVHFFRANRKFMVHVNAIEQVRPYDNNRLLVIIKDIPTTEEIIISREKTADFRNWADT